MNRKQRRADSKQGGHAAPAAAHDVAGLFAAAMRHAQAGRLAQAVGCFRQAVTIAPRMAAAHYNLGKALGEQGRHQEAVDSLRKAVELAPELAEAQANLGAALQALGRLEEAALHCRRAVALAPTLPVAHFNLGTVLEAQRRLDEADGCYRQAIALRPDFAEAHLNLAMVLLARGRLWEGWDEYEWRWQTPRMRGECRHFTQPQWRGEAGGGRTLLLHAEQGFGDTLQFCRYATLAAAQGWRVILQVQPPLVRLLQNLPGAARVLGDGAVLPPFDLQCPLLSLPLALGTTLETVPAPSPYLHADEAMAAAWRARLATVAAPGLLVGLVWAGNRRLDIPAHAALDRRRSVTLQQLAPLSGIPGVRFISLQKQAAAPVPSMIDFMSEIGDFADTAALVANLDLVIAVDTAVAHLAAALGKPVWLLNRYDACWRWIGGRNDSPWYPTLRLYNQPRPGDWDSVIASMADDLRGLAGRSNPK